MNLFLTRKGLSIISKQSIPPQDDAELKTNSNVKGAKGSPLAPFRNWRTVLINDNQYERPFRSEYGTTARAYKARE